ncbi:unnamed protein product [Rodentolepis nana]|uniref:ShKT domain-containing protein n=1 Tax=Rodentolepis nana TaxID=102285 RepID=A0A0R3TDM4_RODNA|nr:unnamed protein product [Rodentolepis nana]
MQKYALIVLMLISATIAIPLGFQEGVDPMDTSPSPVPLSEEMNATALLDDSPEQVSATTVESAISEEVAIEATSHNQNASFGEEGVDGEEMQTVDPQNTPSEEIEGTKDAAFEVSSSFLEYGDLMTRDVPTESSEVEETQERSVENELEGTTNVATSAKEQTSESENNYEEVATTPLGLEDPEVIEEAIATENLEDEILVEETSVESETEEAPSSGDGESTPTSQALEFLSPKLNETKTPMEDIETEAPESDEVNENSPENFTKASFVEEALSTEASIKETSPSTSVKVEELEVEQDLENSSVEPKEITSEINATDSESNDWEAVGEMTEEVEDPTITESSIEEKEISVTSDEVVEGQESSVETSIGGISLDASTTPQPDLDSLMNASPVVEETEMTDSVDISLKASSEPTEGVTTPEATPHSEIQPSENETQVPTTTDSDQRGMHPETEGVISNETTESLAVSSENGFNQSETTLSTSEPENSLGDSSELGTESEATEVKTDIFIREISESSKQTTTPEDQVYTEAPEVEDETQENRHPETGEEESAVGTKSGETTITTDRIEHAMEDEGEQTEEPEGESEVTPQGDEKDLETEEAVASTLPVEPADDETVPPSEPYVEPGVSAHPNSSNFGSFPALQSERVALESCKFPSVEDKKKLKCQPRFKNLALALYPCTNKALIKENLILRRLG